MATNCTISIRNPDNTFTSIYVHYDGNLEEAGEILKNHYTTVESIEALMSLGDLSSLAESPELPEGHSFDNRIKGHCVPYSLRDEESPAIVYENEGEFMPDTMFHPFNYLFEDGVWKYRLETEDSNLPYEIF